MTRLTRCSKTKWNMDHVLACLKNLGQEKTEEIMTTVGFSEEEIEKLFEVARVYQIKMMMAALQGQSFGGNEPSLQVENPNSKFSAFKGEGRTLGASKSTSEETQESNNNSSSSPLKEGMELPSAAEYEHKLDTNQPSTTIQIRLLSGDKLIEKFNLFHTVQNIHSFVSRYLSLIFFVIFLAKQK
jgi:hypothetical protein